MRVKISYSVEFDDVPKIVQAQLYGVISELDNMKYKIHPDAIPPDNIKKLDAIDSVRRKLATLDAQLEDCYSILAGYNKALADMKLPKADPVEDSTDDGD